MARAGSISGTCDSSSKMSYKWTVTDFSTYKSGTPINSPILLTNDKSVKMQLEIILNEDKVSCYMNFVPMMLAERVNTFTLRFRNLNHTLMGIYDLHYRFPEPSFRRLGQCKFIDRYDLLADLTDDTLCVCVEMDYSSSFSRKDSIVDDYPEINQFTSFSRVWDLLLKDSKFKDLVVSVRGTDLPAHRAVLAANSPVFEAMFNHDTIEKRTDRLQMDDVDQEVAKLFLQFMYCGSTEVLDMNIALALLRLSHKYGMEHLKTYCANFIFMHLNNDNVTRVLISSDMFNVPELRSHAIEYFCKNKSTFNFEKFKSVLDESPFVLADIIKKLPPLS